MYLPVCLFVCQPLFFHCRLTEPFLLHVSGSPVYNKPRQQQPWQQHLSFAISPYVTRSSEVKLPERGFISASAAAAIYPPMSSLRDGNLRRYLTDVVWHLTYQFLTSRLMSKNTGHYNRGGKIIIITVMTIIAVGVKVVTIH